jgi:hypothetical protein
MAEVLAECGARVTLADIDEKRLERSTQRLVERGWHRTSSENVLLTPLDARLKPGVGRSSALPAPSNEGLRPPKGADHDPVMRRAHLSLALLAALVALAVVVTPASGATALTASQVIARFKAATGSTLLVDKRSSYAGHYTALSLSPSISNQGRYGRFTLYVVGTSTTTADIARLLADGHSGVLGTPGPSSIYWESGQYLGGGTFWLAKKQYGPNLVLWWFGAKRKVDAAFTRIHKPLLTKVVVAS